MLDQYVSVHVHTVSCCNALDVSTHYMGLV